jgi:PhzF family phenazine biosynthesis protein
VRPGGRQVPYRIVDAFTGQPFRGNPAAVVLPDEEGFPGQADRSLLQSIAAEMNLSETAFPHPPGDDGVRRLRWFTPSTEVTLCGHATLGTAHALLEDGAADPLRFRSLSGPLEVRREGDGRLRLDFPADPPNETSPPPGFLEALGVMPPARYLAGARAAIVRLDDEAAVRSVRPDIPALLRVPMPIGILGVAVTAPADREDVDFVSRFFGPWVGVDEDPVTGMAHCVLAPYWAEELEREELEARQLSRRGGALRVRVTAGRVHLVGEAVTVARGTLFLP